MKKGFILALLMVAMVALVLPVSARAPIVNTLPKIIIGDMDDDSGGMGILRYPDALDLLDENTVNWNNPRDIFTTETLHAYLYNPASGTPDPNVLPYKATGIIDVLTSTEYTWLVTTGTLPASSARLTSYTGSYQLFSVSLFDATRHPAMTNPATAVPATDGELTSASYVKETTLLLVAAVPKEGGGLMLTDLGTTSTADSISPLKVLCQSAVSDDKDAPAEPVASYLFDGSASGWTYGTLAGFPAAPQAGGGGSDTGVGFAITTAVGADLTHAYWLSPVEISGSSAQAGRVYRAIAQLTSNAASSDACPGWRVTFRNTGFSHYGKVTMATTGAQPAGEANAPFTGSGAYEARIYWVAPYFLGDMGPTQGQASFAGAGSIPADMRKYRVTFDCIGTTGDLGTLMMDEMAITYIPRPNEAPVTAVAWGSGAGETAFSAVAGNGGWKAGTSLLSLGFADGTRTINTGNVVLAIGSATGSRYVGAVSQDYELGSPYLPVNQLLPESDHLYRFSFSLYCANKGAVPTYRCNINGSYQVPLVSVVPRKMQWAEYLAFSNMQLTGKNQNYVMPGQSATECPGAPSSSSTSPTRLDVYVWSHKVAPQTGTAVTGIYPLLSVVDTGKFQTDSQWGDPTTNMTFSSATWEDLGQDW